MPYYEASLTTREEVGKFCADFFKLELTEMTDVEIDYRRFGFRVRLVPSEGIGVELLQASFENGPLRNNDWHEKFKIKKSIGER